MLLKRSYEIINFSCQIYNSNSEATFEKIYENTLKYYGKRLRRFTMKAISKEMSLKNRMYC